MVIRSHNHPYKNSSDCPALDLPPLPALPGYVAAAVLQFPQPHVFIKLTATGGYQTIAAHGSMSLARTICGRLLVITLFASGARPSKQFPDAAVMRADEGGNLHLTPALQGRVLINGTDVLTETRDLRAEIMSQKDRINAQEAIIASQNAEIAALKEQSRAFNALGPAGNSSLLDLLEEMKKQTDYTQMMRSPFGKLYAAGGDDGRPGELFNSVEKFDGEKWTSGPSMAIKHTESSVAAYAVNGVEYLFAVGGTGPIGNLNSVNKFDGEKWTSAPPMATKRGGLGVAVYAVDGVEYLFAVGGYYLEGKANHHLSSVEKFDGQQWTSAPSMLNSRDDLGVATFKVDEVEYLFAVGGFNGSDYLNSVEMFDGEKWTLAPPMISKRRDLGVATFKIRGVEHLFAVGGRDGANYLNSVERFDGESWTAAPSMISTRYNHVAASFMVSPVQYLFALGGSDGTKDLNSVEKFDGEMWTAAPSMISKRHGLGAAAFGRQSLICVFHGWLVWPRYAVEPASKGHRN